MHSMDHAYFCDMFNVSPVLIKRILIKLRALCVFVRSYVIVPIEVEV